MKLKHYMAAAASALVLTVFAGSASATSLFLDVTFTATDFITCACVGSVGGPAPESTVTGEFQIHFDPTQTYVDDTTDITLENLNIALGSAFGFNYTPTGTGPNGELAGNLYVGGNGTGVVGTIYIPPTTVQNNFYLQIDDIATTPSFDQLGYTQVAAGQNFFYDISGQNEGTVSVTNVSTPEPASLALFGIGLLALTTIRRQVGRAIGPQPPTRRP
jgi:hypothetical protein